MKTLRVGCGLLLFAGASLAQQYVMSTVAGGAPPPTPVPASSALIAPGSGAADSAGNLYLTSGNCVFKLDLNGIVTRIAGNSRPGYSGDGGPATAAQLNGPSGLAIDSGGNIFIAETYNNRIRRVSPSGIITTVAGGGGPPTGVGDGGPATAARLNTPGSLTFDSAGNLFVADEGNSRVRKIAPSGIITTIAGTGVAGDSGDGGLAVNAGLTLPFGLAFDTSGDLFIADVGQNRVRRVSPTGTITAFAGTGVAGFSGDGGAATSAQLNNPTGLALTSQGDLLIADYDNFRIRIVSTNGLIGTVAGNGQGGYSGDGAAATQAGLTPGGLVSDSTGGFFIFGGYLRHVSANGIISTVGGAGNSYFFSGDGGQATSALLSHPSGVAVDGSGNLFIADTGNRRVRRVVADGSILTVAGGGSALPGDGGLATAADIIPECVAFDSAGNLLICDLYSIRKVSTSGGVITTFAGTGSPGSSGDGGLATAAAFRDPRGIAKDSSGNVFIADAADSRVRKVSQSGIITTFAGNGTAGYSGDGGPATSAQLSYPTGVAVDSAGTVYILDEINNRIRKVSNGIITTFAMGTFTGMALDVASNVFVTGTSGIQEFSPSGVITASYTALTPGNFRSLLETSLGAIDSAGDLYFIDSGLAPSEQWGGAIYLARPTGTAVLVSAVLDAASEASSAVSPGKIAVIYGGGLGPTQLVQNEPSNSLFGTQLAGTNVSFNGTPAPILYTSATQVAAIVPYEISGPTAQVTVAYQSQVSSAFSVPVAASAPSFFSYNQTGSGQAAAINNIDGTINNATNPVKIGSYIQLYLTGEGQTTPAGVDGKLGGPVATHPNLSVTATVGGLPATVQYAGGVFGDVAGLMQVNVLIPPGVQPGGYVPVVVTVGNASTANGAAWIAVSN